ncbi:three-prime repair exonuclease 1 isoform X3 [Manis pentadactyla]|uniref:three-prime repair exonuclease 1 isoform X3 n=1 Tax=Manis pentadactyla TaxID=143292 RepID=UPI00255CC1BA|nr:three-prime repair exonuclease 1 isoform X3 [Manis pentadactyla]
MTTEGLRAGASPGAGLPRQPGPQGLSVRRGPGLRTRRPWGPWAVGWGCRGEGGLRLFHFLPLEPARTCAPVTAACCPRRTLHVSFDLSISSPLRKRRANLSPPVTDVSARKACEAPSRHSPAQGCPGPNTSPSFGRDSTRAPAHAVVYLLPVLTGRCPCLGGPEPSGPILSLVNTCSKACCGSGCSQDHTGRCFVIFLLNCVCLYLSVCILSLTKEEEKNEGFVAPDSKTNARQIISLIKSLNKTSWWPCVHRPPSASGKPHGLTSGPSHMQFLLPAWPTPSLHPSDLRSKHHVPRDTFPDQVPDECFGEQISLYVCQSINNTLFV